MLLDHMNVIHNNQSHWMRARLGPEYALIFYLTIPILSNFLLRYILYEDIVVILQVLNVNLLTDYTTQL